ncbi:MAG: hypothetical protein U9N39_10555 [Campylobacterota bacterium]|nr:hypothetical protein [Campylobacterota bacterium]
MLSKEECYRARSQIEALCVLENNAIAISTKIHGVKILSHDSCSTLKNLSIDLLSHQTTAVAFSKKSQLFAFANHRIIYIFNSQNKTLLQTIYTNEGDIELLSFVADSKYLVAGTKHGRVMQYRYDGRAHLSRLCSFGQTRTQQKQHLKNNYVSAFAFKESLFASSGYGGAITILKMSSYANRHIINSSKVRIDALCFLEDDRIVSGNIEGFIQIHSLKKHQATKTIPTSFRNINKILLMPNSRYVMVSGQNKKLILIDAVLGKIASENYLSFNHNVTHMALTSDKKLFVSLEDDTLQKINLPTPQDLKTHLFNSELDKAYTLIEKDPMLQETREHKRVEVMYEKLYTQAIDSLINANAQEARKFIKTFEKVPSKKEDVSSIFKAFEFYPKFKTLFLEKKYALAYAIASNYPALKRTYHYKKMEEIFKEAFGFAQKQILIGRQDLAEEILSSYSSVSSKKTIIRLLLTQNRDFLDFLKAINEKNHLQIEKLVQKNEVFTQIPNFTTLKNSTEESLLHIRDAIDSGEPKKALELIKNLRSTHSVKEELQELYRDCKLLSKLQEKYEESDFKSAYEIIDSSYTLKNLELTSLLEKHWDKLMNRCEESALKGDIKSIKSILGELIYVKSRVDKIGDLLRLSFHMKIKGLMSKRNFKSAESIIYSYIDIFGRDSEILTIMSLYEKTAKSRLAITQNQQADVARDNWLNSAIIMS